MMLRTEHPVVLVHGVFGYGRKRPFWNRWVPYWPEKALDEMHANYVVVDVGALSSDHDRACEAFYQLYGGRVDYGEAHARKYGHDRYGETYELALHPDWSSENPVHLVGHSVGATTAIELYQLVCQDYFGVGSDHSWVKSIVSIAGPLSGTTLTHFFGLHDAELVSMTLGHFIGASLCTWHRLQAHFPMLKNVFDYHMPQWEFVSSYREVFSSRNRILNSPDLAVYDILPARRQKRNQSLVEMDKPFLVSVVTSSSTEIPVMELVMAGAIVCLVALAVALWVVAEAAVASLTCGVMAFATWLWLRKRIFLPMIQWRMRCCVQKLHQIFDGFDRSEWEPNDGAVNICSMHYPQQLPSPQKQAGVDSDSDSDASTASSSSSATVSPPSPFTRSLTVSSDGSLVIEKPATRQADSAAWQLGLWYVHHVASNHKAGTSFDRESPKLFRELLGLIANEFEQ